MKADKWQGAELALRQFEAAKIDLDAYRRGVVKDSWKTIGLIVAGLDAVDPITILDVGCGIGAASEILPGVSGREIDYWGTDCNQEAIAIAWSEFPNSNFMPTDILTMPTGALFDVVMSNGSLNHIRDWKSALTNMAALSRRYVLLHRLWVYMDDTRSSGVLAQAYGRNLWHMRLNQGEMIDLMAALDFELAESCSSDGSGDPNEGWTYLFEGLDKT